MAGPLKRLTPGQKLPAIPSATWNRFCDVADSQRVPGAFPGAFSAATEAQFVKLINATSADREPYQIVGYDSHGISFPNSNSDVPERPVPIANAKAPGVGERFAILSTSVQDGFPVDAQVQRIGLLPC